MRRIWDRTAWIGATILGSTIFALGFSIFLQPNEINTGGISGLAMIATELLKAGSVGSISILLNIPLFLAAGIRIGKRFFAGSALGMLVSSVLIDCFSGIRIQTAEPLVGALYGGVLCGFGLGMVFASGASTGGSDILIRLVKLRWRSVPIGQIAMMFDAMVVALTGLVFRDLSKALYSGIAAFVCGQVMDVVVYRFDYSRVALIITACHEEVARAIGLRLDRGATFLHAEGSYSRRDTRVVLTVVRKRQLAELKELVMEIDPNAFVIVQEAHQVLGDGFSRYSKDAL